MRDTLKLERVTRIPGSTASDFIPKLRRMDGCPVLTRGDRGEWNTR